MVPALLRNVVVQPRTRRVPTGDRVAYQLPKHSTVLYLVIFWTSISLGFFIRQNNAIGAIPNQVFLSFCVLRNYLHWPTRSHQLELSSLLIHDTEGYFTGIYAVPSGYLKFPKFLRGKWAEIAISVRRE